MTKRSSARQADILRLLQGENKAMSAYAVLDALSADEPRLAPTTVYRALNALTDQGCVHRLESINAFIACRGDQARPHNPIVAICERCGAVEEFCDQRAAGALDAVADRAGFAARRRVIELQGHCADCRA